ncbi:MAG: glycosyltransferase family 1 protein [Solirubrobacterales bacterium]|nr:glycosyltransferase family 1 protein [Solirubrobacterales bacterium]
MTSFLLASVSATGHVSPMVAVARELVARGNDVTFYTGDGVADRVTAVGAAHVGLVDAQDVGFDALGNEFTDRPKGGVRQIRYDVRHAFVGRVPGQVQDLVRYVEAFRPDVLLAETGMALAARMAAEITGVPWAALSVTAPTIPSPEIAPFGLGLAPSSSALGRVRNRVLTALTNRVIFGPAARDYDAMRADAGLPLRAESVLEVGVSPYLFLQPTVPSFEYPRSSWPAHAHFVGPLLPPTPPGMQTPAWIDELDPSRPVVLVTQGTVATDPQELLLPALEALAGEPVLVVGTTGGPDPAELGPLPANARVERFVPFHALMPKLAAMVSNGGYGGLHFAMSHGVPLVVAGNSEDKSELVARVNWSGVGVGLRTNRAKPAQLRDAVRKVLGEPEHGARAAAIAAEMARTDAAGTSADLLEELARTGAPVTRVPERQAAVLSA